MERQRIDFTKFVRVLAPVPLSLEFVLRAILILDNKPILLCVDELKKAPDPKKIVTILGSCLSSLQSNQFNTLVTTLDWRPIKEGTVTDSNRPLDLIEMKSLTQQESLHLFKDFLHLSSAVEYLVLFASGHPRTLEAFYMYLRDCNGVVPPKLHAMLEAVYSGYAQNIRYATTTKHLKMALSGETVNIDDEIIRCVMAGIFKNDLTPNQQRMVPETSLAQLYFFTKYGGEDEIRVALINLLTV